MDALTIDPFASQKQATRTDPQTLALSALGWMLDDAQRADRFLGLTGLTPDALRAGLEDGGVLTSVLDFLSNHEPDLIAAADAVGCEPAQLMAARRELQR